LLGHDLGLLLANVLRLQERARDSLEIAAWVLSASVVFLFAPEILRRVLRTERLGNSPLRRRLDDLCRRTGIRYRDILLWKTDHNMGNAAVMGFFRAKQVATGGLAGPVDNDEDAALSLQGLGHQGDFADMAPPQSPVPPISIPQTATESPTKEHA